MKARMSARTKAQTNLKMNTDAEIRRRQISGLLIIAAIILLIALLRADRHVLFPPGWWRF